MSEVMAIWKVRDISRDTPPTSFRVAYYVTKKCLELAEKLGKSIDKLTLEEFQSVNKYIGPDVYDVFDLNKAMERRNIVGAPGTKQVKKQLQRWKRKLSML
jgi:argininosuccinate lyase